MEEIPRILVGLAIGPTSDRRFFESLPVFSHSVALRNLANLEFKFVWDKPLVSAQNMFADKMLEGSYDYLLTIEDDHHGFSSDMLESCLSCNAEVVAISYRSRHFPFDKIPMHYHETDRNGVRMYTGSSHTSGYHEADLAGFGFTLIRADIFSRLEKPVFRLNTEYYKKVGPRATDIDFCYRVQQAGGRIIGCYDYILPHRDIEEATYKEMIVDGILCRQSMFTRLNNMMKDSRKLKQLNQDQPK